MNQLKRTQSLCHTVAVMILQNDSRNDKTLSEKFPRLNIKTTTFSHRYCTIQQSKKPNHVQSLANIWPYTEINFQIYCSSQNKI